MHSRVGLSPRPELAAPDGARVNSPRRGPPVSLPKTPGSRALWGNAPHAGEHERRGANSPHRHHLQSHHRFTLSVRVGVAQS